MFLRANRRKMMGQTSRMWCLDTLSNIVGTVIGIILTFGVTFWIEYRNTQNDNKRATLMVLENVSMINNECKEAFNRIEESKPILEEILELTPEQVMKMPEDSIYYYMAGFPFTMHVYQDFARNLLNTNFDIVRTTNNYVFLMHVHYFYSIYDRVKALYEKEGPDKMLQNINEVLIEVSVEKGELYGTTRWELMQLAGSNRMKIYIKSYLDSFIPMLRVYMEWLENAIKLIVKSCEYKYEDFEDFIVTMPHEEEQTE